VNTEHEPLSLRLRAEFGYAYRGFDASSFTNFSNAYRDAASVPARGVSPWTTVDLQLSYQFAQDSAGMLAGVKVSFSVLNVFGVQPPFLNAQLDAGYDRENASLYERQTSLTVRKSW
jgi:outer membrane receptor protein involved in Fe transport